MSNKGKYYFLIGSFKLGGTERTASRIGLGLLERGYDVKFLLVNNVFDYNDPKLKENSIILSKPGLPKILKIPFVYFKLFKIVWTQRPDKLISFSLGLNKLVFFLFFPKTIFRIESNIFHYKKKLHRRYIPEFFSRFPHIEKVLIPSKGLYDAAYKYFESNEKLIQIDNPLYLDEISILKEESIKEHQQLDDGKFIVSAGRLNSSKGFEQLIEVYSQTLKNKGYKLVILGDGPEKQNLLSKIRELILEEDVLLLGFEKNPYRFFSKAKFFILNSEHESFGNVIIEAFGCDIPVVSNDCNFGPRHIIQHGENGLLYNKTNKNEFKQSLYSLIDSEDLYNKLKSGAMKSKEKYSIDNIILDWENKILNNTENVKK